MVLLLSTAAKNWIFLVSLTAADYEPPCGWFVPYSLTVSPTPSTLFTDGQGQRAQKHTDPSSSLAFSAADILKGLGQIKSYSREGVEDL